MAKSKGKGKQAKRPVTTDVQPTRQRVKVLGPNFKVRWEWREGL